MSVRASRAPSDVRERLLAGIDAWLAGPDSPESPGAGGAGDRMSA
jgi:adenosine deaminase